MTSLNSSLPLYSINNFRNYKVKVYPDGKTGQYMNKCCQCDKVFIGYKNDSTCGDCAMPIGSEINLIGEKEN